MVAHRARNPWILAVGVIALIIFIREQVLGLVSLALLGAASAITAWFPSFTGLLTITMLSSIGFHYYETVNQSLQLQWLKKEEAPRFLGKLLAVGSAATLVAYGLIVLGWKALDLSYNFVYLISGGATVAIAIFCLIAYPQFEAPTPQRKQWFCANATGFIMHCNSWQGRGVKSFGVCGLYDGRTLWV